MKEDRLLQCVDYLTFKINQIEDKMFYDDEGYFSHNKAYLSYLVEELNNLRNHFVDYINGEKYEPNFNDGKYEEYLLDKMTKGEDKE